MDSSVSKRILSLIFGLIICLLPMIFTSCGSTRSLIYMRGKFDTAALSKVTYQEPIIEKGDILGIIVYSDNPEATRIYNQTVIAVSGSSAGAVSVGSTTTAGVSPTSGGYLVDENGNINFQGLGVMHVGGLTRSGLKDSLDARLKNYLSNPYYSIRFLNYRFTMLGEVAKPGVYSISGDRVSLLDALGMAGDMTFFGRRDSILVVRETLGKREFARLDMTKPEILISPYFYLQSGDVVIVEPTRKKIAANDQTVIRDVSIATAIISTIAILYSVFK